MHQDIMEVQDKAGRTEHLGQLIQCRPFKINQMRFCDLDKLCLVGWYCFVISTKIWLVGTNLYCWPKYGWFCDINQNMVGFKIISTKIWWTL